MFCSHSMALSCIESNVHFSFINWLRITKEECDELKDKEWMEEVCLRLSPKPSVDFIFYGIIIKSKMIVHNHKAWLIMIWCGEHARELKDVFIVFQQCLDQRKIAVLSLAGLFSWFASTECEISFVNNSSSHCYSHVYTKHDHHDCTCVPADTTRIW